MPAPEIKFCGLTRAADAAVAAELGAEYAGVILARGPRLVDAARAREVFAGLGGAPVARVGVFGSQSPEEILRIAEEARLDVLQLHDGGNRDACLMLRKRFPGRIWAVLSVNGPSVSLIDSTGLDVIDAVVLDTAVAGRSGGTGVPFDWAESAAAVVALKARTPVILAGGLRPANVAEAVRILAPAVVDVSSGVEVSPGIKDHALMRAFADAARTREG